MKELIFHGVLVMISDLPLFRIYNDMARHAAQTQSITATNIARANVPEYKALEVESFESFMMRTKVGDQSGAVEPEFQTFESNAPASPNGNTVNIEREVFRSAEAMNQHELAMTVYTKSLDLLRSATGRSR